MNRRATCWLLRICAAYLIGSVSGMASACGIYPSVLAARPKQVAERGYLVRGRVVRAFDPVRRTSEVIEADEIIIGEGRPRRFVVFREDRYFDERRTGEITTCDFNVRVVDATPKLYVLHPLPAATARAGEERWTMELADYVVTSQPGLANTLKAAKRNGRLRRPGTQTP